MLEDKLNAFARTWPHTDDADVAQGRQEWLNLNRALGDPVKDPADWVAAHQDVVEQMLVGLGWRIRGACEHFNTGTVVVTSSDPRGVQFVVSSHPHHSLAELSGELTTDEVGEVTTDDDWPSDLPAYFHPSAVARFARSNGGRQGVAVLGFAVSPGGVDAIYSRYLAKHPDLLVPHALRHYPEASTLEVYAYYQGDTHESEADTGTILRFVEAHGEDPDFFVLPGIKTVDAIFDGMKQAAYSDHWVSNVVSREGFLDTLQDTLGFTSKVDFNAGVVAAGEAQIESTVTGNTPGVTASSAKKALKDQSQVYLPINNALSEVGHVHMYLKEIGQGVQHIASRVADLPKLVQKANEVRRITGAGLSFLKVPRSYYGTLTAARLSRDASVGMSVAEDSLEALRHANCLDSGDIVDLGVTRESVLSVVVPVLRETFPEADELEASAGRVTELVLRARYSNLYALLRDQLSEETYLKIVRNNILVDVQGKDLLLQIFTANILQRKAGEEAPFLEFIQRVCSGTSDEALDGQEVRIRPGCGGFGIRNFLTLFLSIEVTKAAKARADAEHAGHAEAAQYYGQMVDLFTAQLEESNPILTAISDAMTGEGEALERGDQLQAALCSTEKTKGQETLQRLSDKYRDLMRRLREEFQPEREFQLS